MSYFHGPLPSPQVCLYASVSDRRLKIERSTHAQTVQHAYRERQNDPVSPSELFQIKLSVRYVIVWVNVKISQDCCDARVAFCVIVIKIIIYSNVLEINESRLLC